MSDEEMPQWAVEARRNRELVESASRHQEGAQRTVDNAIVNIEAERSALASIYAQAGAHSIVENAIGNAISAVRKALAQLRKSAGELAQQPLPMQ